MCRLNFPRGPRLCRGGLAGDFARPADGRAQASGPANLLAGLNRWGSVRGMQGPQQTAERPAALDEDRLLRPEQAAWYLNVKTSWVYEAVGSGRLPCRRVGRHIRFTPDA